MKRLLRSSKEVEGQVEVQVAGEANLLDPSSHSVENDVPPVHSDDVLSALESSAIQEMNRLKHELAEKSSYGGGINISTGKVTRGRKSSPQPTHIPVNMWAGVGKAYQKGKSNCLHLQGTLFARQPDHCEHAS